jgi:ceramide glucosyltransferase
MIIPGLVAAGILVVLLFLQILTAVLVIFRLQLVNKTTQQSAPTELVSVIVSIVGLDAWEAEVALSALNIAARPVEIIYCAFDENDPSVMRVQAELAKRPDVNARILIGREHTTPNPKLDNIEKGFVAARGDFLLCIDGNVDVPPDLIEQLMLVWDQDTAVASALPIGLHPNTLAADVECAFLNTFYARWQLAGDQLGAGFAQGKVLMFRRSFVERCGGFSCLQLELAEDSATTKLARQAGKTVRLAQRPVGLPLGRRPLRDVWERHRRWAQYRRQAFPLLFTAEAFTSPVMPAAAGVLAAVAFHWPIGATAAIIIFGCYGIEAALARAVKWPFGPRSLLACLIRDLMLLAIWPLTLLQTRYVWRGAVVDIDVWRGMQRRNRHQSIGPRKKR